MANVVLIKAGTAEGVIAPYRIVKFGAADGSYLQAAAVSDALCGVNESLAVSAGERVDIIKIGIADVEFGGAGGQRQKPDR